MPGYKQDRRSSDSEVQLGQMVIQTVLTGGNLRRQVENSDEQDNMPGYRGMKSASKKTISHVIIAGRDLRSQIVTKSFNFFVQDIIWSICLDHTWMF